MLHRNRERRGELFEIGFHRFPVVIKRRQHGAGKCSAEHRTVFRVGVNPAIHILVFDGRKHGHDSRPDIILVIGQSKIGDSDDSRQHQYNKPFDDLLLIREGVITGHG